MEVSLVENLQREDLNPIEEAQALRILMDEHELTQEELSDRLGKSRSAIANTCGYCPCPKRVMEMVREGLSQAGTKMPYRFKQ